MPKKNLKNDLEYILDLIEELDHPKLNFIKNSMFRDGYIKKISIPVDLYKDGEPVFKSNVEMMGASAQLNIPVLTVLLDELDKRNIKIEWDAVRFTSVDPWPRDSWGDIELLAESIKKYRDKGLRKSLSDAFNYKADNVEDLITVFSAAILAQTIEIKSDDFDKHKKPTVVNRIFKKFGM